jgi:hypothetical protein
MVRALAWIACGTLFLGESLGHVRADQFDGSFLPRRPQVDSMDDSKLRGDDTEGVLGEESFNSCESTRLA